MTVVKHREIVPYSPDKMYALVNDIEAYPDFLPWCGGTTVHFRDEDELQATIVVEAKGYSKSFTTHNRMQINKMIEIRLVDGPFNHLEGFWRFDEEENGHCKVSFDLEFEFANQMISKVVSPVFQSVSDSMVVAFTERANQLYGNQG